LIFDVPRHLGKQQIALAAHQAQADGFRRCGHVQRPAYQS